MAATTPGDGQPRFPGFDVVEQRRHWDPVTAGVVLSRLSLRDPPRFFDLAEEAVVRPLLDLLLDQRADPKVPLLEMVDARLAAGQTDGWHYEGLPQDHEAWRLTLSALDSEAHDRCGTGFATADEDDQRACIQAVQDAGSDPWHGLPADRVWSLWTRYACTAFYSHPWAWNEIGFSGPAYPRGYKNAGVDRREPYEVPDHHAVDPTGGTP